MPKIGPDKKKLDKIRKVLRDHPKGVWVREIARQTKLHSSTISFYFNKYMADEIVDIPTPYPRVRMVKLKRVSPATPSQKG
jgi:DNA invertase Pin-like site-specific DNA recombinase